MHLCTVRFIGCRVFCTGLNWCMCHSKYLAGNESSNCSIQSSRRIRQTIPTCQSYLGCHMNYILATVVSKTYISMAGTRNKNMAYCDHQAYSEQLINYFFRPFYIKQGSMLQKKKSLISTLTRRNIYTMLIFSM